MNARFKITVVALLCLAPIAWFIDGSRSTVTYAPSAPPSASFPPAITRPAPSATDTLLAEAFQQRRSNLQITGLLPVSRLLPDDNDGSRHQKFILQTSTGQTILVAHNIDLAPRIPNLKVGDTIEFYGEYEWNEKGGVIHWTHHDPANRHPHGWLRHNGLTYQ